MQSMLVCISRHRSRQFVFAVTLSCCAVQIALGQVLGMTSTPTEARNAGFPIVDLSNPDAATHSLALPQSEELRSMHYGHKVIPIYNERNPAESGSFSLTSHFNYNVKPDPLRRNQGVIAVEGLVTSPRTFLTQDRTDIYSTFEFAQEKILRGQLKSAIVTIERRGGFVSFPNGKVRYVGVDNWGLPCPGKVYMLFLKWNSDSGSYTIEGGFAEDEGAVKSLDRDGTNYDGLKIEQLRAIVSKP